MSTAAANVRGIKQAIVASSMLAHGVKSLSRPPKAETKEKVIASAQKKLDDKVGEGDARQIFNWLFRHAEGRSVQEMADRLKAKAAPAAAKAVKKTTGRKASKKTTARKSNVTKTENSETQAAA